MTSKIALLLCVLSAAGLLGGCASGGFIGPQPLVTDPMGASNVTLYRDGSWVGLVGAIHVRLDGSDLMRLWRNQSFSFRLDPGSHVLDYSIGINECRRAILIDPGQSYRFRLVPNCTIWEYLQ